MASDSRGSTPLHLALSRLRILNTVSPHKHTPSQRRHEMEKVCEFMYKIYKYTTHLDVVKLVVNAL